MERYSLERAISEPNRRATGGGRDTQSNYYFCPLKCPTCRYFAESNSNWPYTCSQGTTDNPSKRSMKEGYRQYDQCKYWIEKDSGNADESYNPIRKLFAEQSRPDNRNTAVSEDAQSPAEKRRLERDEKELDRQKKNEEAEKEHECEEAERELEAAEESRKEEDRRTHCFYCGNTGYLLEFHDRYFHENCLQKFKDSENGIRWIAEQEMWKQYNSNRSLIIEKVKEYHGVFGFFPDNELRSFTGNHDTVEATINLDLAAFYRFLEEEYKRKLEENERTHAEIMRLKANQKLLEEQRKEEKKKTEDAMNEKQALLVREQEKEFSIRTRRTSLILCIFLGWLGIHRFYNRKYVTGLIQMFRFGGYSIWWLIDIFQIFSGGFRDKNGRRFREYK